MTEIHKPPAGESLIGSHVISKDCPCEPVRSTTYRAASSGRHGRHQGYNVKIVWTHQTRG